MRAFIYADFRTNIRFDPRLALLFISAEMPYSWAFPPFLISDNQS